MRSDFPHQQTTSMADRKIATLDKDKIDKIMDNAEAKNTKRQTNTAVTLLRQYLTARNMPTDFESLPYIVTVVIIQIVTEISLHLLHNIILYWG
jgi:predicted component of type VI protein secretion system